MCDETDLANFARKGLSRRGFGAGAIAGAAAACAPIDTMPGGQSGALTESTVSFATDNGTADGFFVHPRESRHPGVIFWPDIAGIREAKRQMARRLAGEGYAVLVMNPYYRDVAREQFADFPSFAAQQGFEKVKPWREKLNAGAIGADANRAAAWLREQGAVDVERGIGSQAIAWAALSRSGAPVSTSTFGLQPAFTEEDWCATANTARTACSTTTRSI